MKFPKADLAQRLARSYDMIDSLYAERDLLLLMLNLLAQELHLGCGLAPNPAAEPGWRFVLVVDLPSGQVWWPVPDERLPSFREVPIYRWHVDRCSPEERLRRLYDSGLHLTRTERTQPLEMMME